MAAAPSPATALASLLLLGLLPMQNHAQAIYRCGNSYSQTPCAGGSVIDADDRRSAEQKAQTDAAAAQAARQADRMEHERSVRQRMDVPATIQISAGPTAPKKGKAPRPNRAVAAKLPGETYFTASSGNNDKQKPKAKSNK